MIAAIVYGISTRLIDSVYHNAELRANGVIREYIHRETLIDKLRKRAARSNPLIASMCMIAAALAAIVLSMGVRIANLQIQLSKATAVAGGAIVVNTSDSDSGFTIVIPESVEEDETTVAETTTTTTTALATTTAVTTTKELATVQQIDDSKPKPGTVYDVDDNVIKFIQSYEGYYAARYYCESHYPTIGYGHVITGGKTDPLWNAHLSKKEAAELLKKDLNGGYKKKLDQFVKENDLVLTKQQYHAMLSFSFNCGASCWYKKKFLFRDTLLKYKDGSKIPASIVRDQLDNWNHGSDGVLPGLTRRRRNEAKLDRKLRYHSIPI